MESLVVPVLILLAVAAGVTLAARAISKRKASAGAEPQAPAATSADLARAAAAKLSEDEHRRLYALIAQGQAMAAIKLYYEATGDGLRASRDAVGALAAHPQPYRGPEVATPEPDDEDDEPQRFPYRYRAIASKGPMVVKNFQLGDIQVEFPLPDVAVLTYEVTQTVSGRGSHEATTQHMADSSTWIRRDGHWICAMHTETPLAH